MQNKLAVFLTVLVLLIPGFVFGQDSPGSYPEKIKNFSVEIAVNKDSSFLVKESILYDFGQNYKHGIFRDIPLKNIAISAVKVSDESGNSYPFVLSRKNGYLDIKIGDPDKTINGEHLYNISYRVQKGLGFFKDHDELYWNVTGNEWNVPIEKSGAIIYLPEKLSGDILKFECFTGAVGSKESNCSFRQDESNNVIFESGKSFSPQEGLTIVLGWPKGIVKEPGILQKILWNLEIFWPILIPVFAFIFLFSKWWKEGRDPKLNKTIIAQYEPPDNLRPAEANFVINQRARPKDISATLIDLAVRGYIKIKEIKKTGFFGKDDYELVKLKDFNSPQEELREYEKTLLGSIFETNGSVLISSLKNKFYSKLPGITNKIYPGIADLKYFISDPQKAMQKWLIIGVILIAAGFAILFTAQNFILFVSVFISALLFFIFSPLMPKKTIKGAEASWYILGFKEYINTAEKYRAQFQEKENIFEKFLPYAIVFGLVDKWAKAFEGIYNNPPSWYEGNFGSRFSSVIFANSINQSLLGINSSLMSSPRGGGSGFGGGGFSGGGGGGGGGGSW